MKTGHNNQEDSMHPDKEQKNFSNFLDFSSRQQQYTDNTVLSLLKRAEKVSITKEQYLSELKEVKKEFDKEIKKMIQLEKKNNKLKKKSRKEKKEPLAKLQNNDSESHPKYTLTSLVQTGLDYGISVKKLDELIESNILVNKENLEKTVEENINTVTSQVSKSILSFYNEFKKKKIKEGSYVTSHGRYIVAINNYKFYKITDLYAKANDGKTSIHFKIVEANKKKVRKTYRKERRKWITSFFMLYDLNDGSDYEHAKRIYKKAKKKP